MKITGRFLVVAVLSLVLFVVTGTVALAAFLPVLLPGTTSITATIPGTNCTVTTVEKYTQHKLPPDSGYYASTNVGTVTLSSGCAGLLAPWLSGTGLTLFPGVPYPFVVADISNSRDGVVTNSYATGLPNLTLVGGPRVGVDTWKPAPFTVEVLPGVPVPVSYCGYAYVVKSSGQQVIKPFLVTGTSVSGFSVLPTPDGQLPDACLVGFQP